MTLNNEAQLRKFLIEKCAKAVEGAEEKVHREIAGNINQFYTEFHPKEYIRTGELFNSLESTGVVKTSNGAIAEIRINQPKWEHGRVPLQSGGYGYANWSDELILDVAMTGGYGSLPHGGYEEGTAIWTESMANLGGKAGIKNILKQELKKQGL